MKVIGIIAGVLLSLFGGYCFFHPAITFASMGWFIGAAVLMFGIIGISTWWRGRKLNLSTGWDLITAVLSVVLGFLVLVNIQTRWFADMTLIVLFGVWLATAGVLNIVGSIKLKPVAWGWNVAWGVILILTALFSLTHPLSAVISLGWCIALSMLTQGVNLIFIACRIPSKDTK